MSEYFEIPEGWVKCQLGAVLSLKNGFAFKSSDYKDEGVPVIRISDISNGEVYNKDSVKVDKNIEAENYLVKKGDILIAMSGATTGKFGIYRSSEKAYQNQRVGNLIPYSENSLDKQLIYYLLFTLKRKVEKDAYGGAQPNISGNKIEAIEFLLPPLPEQHAIVSMIEQLFSELDNGIESLKTAQQQLKVYRQSVLKSAFEGKLTEQWRKQKSNQESIDILLNKIRAARENYFKSKEKKMKSVVGISEEENAMMKNLPKNWSRQRLNDISFLVTDGKHGDCEDQNNSGYYFVSAKDIYEGKINYENARQIRNIDFEEVHRRTDLQPEDVIVTNAGTIGRIALALSNEKTQRTTFQKSVAIIKKPNNLINSKYLAYHLECDVEKIKLASKGTAQINLLLGTMSELIISVCSVEEQHQIVQEIESRLSECDNMEATITTSLQQAETLRQSILKKSFEGKLLSERELETVRQDPTWEPAEKLLERIRAEKAVLHSGKKGWKSKA